MARDQNLMKQQTQSTFKSNRSKDNFPNADLEKLLNIRNANSGKKNKINKSKILRKVAQDD